MQSDSVLINVCSVIVGVIYERNTLKEMSSQKFALKKRMFLKTNCLSISQFD